MAVSNDYTPVVNTKKDKVSRFMLFADPGTHIPAKAKVKGDSATDTTNGNDYAWDAKLESIDALGAYAVLRLKTTKGKAAAAKPKTGVGTFATGLDAGEISITLTDGSTEGPEVTPIVVAYVVDDDS